MKKIFIFLLTAFTLSTGAQNKKRKKVIEREEVVVIKKDTTTQIVEEVKPSFKLSEEDKNRMKYTKTIPIGTNVFVQLVFSSAVQVVRSGAPDLAMVRNEDNVVTIQALQDGVSSNISVKTADGLYYSYKIVSEEGDIPLFYEIPIADAVNGKSKLIEDNKKKIVEKMSAQEVAQTIYNYDGFIKNRNTGSYRDIYVSIRGIYIDKGKLYFLFHFANKSTIDYKIERFQFFTMPVKKSKKRIENEEKEYNPIFYYKNLTDLRAKSEDVMVAVFDQFTLNDQKKIQVTMTENGGERTVRLDIDSKKIVEARQL